jgi:hypothetical protein
MNDDLGFIYPCAECDGIGGALVDSMTLYGVPGGFDWGRCEWCGGRGIEPLPQTDDQSILETRVILWLSYRDHLGCDMDTVLTPYQIDGFRDWVREHHPTAVENALLEGAT